MLVKTARVLPEAVLFSPLGGTVFLFLCLGGRAGERARPQHTRDFIHVFMCPEKASGACFVILIEIERVARK